MSRLLFTQTKGIIEDMGKTFYHINVSVFVVVEFLYDQTWQIVVNLILIIWE